MVGVIAVLNMIIGIVGWVWLFWRTTQRWEEYPSEIRMLMVMSITLLFCLLAVSAEVLASDHKLKASVIVIFATKLNVLYILWRTRDTKYRTGLRNPGSGPQAGQVNKDIP